MKDKNDLGEHICSAEGADTQLRSVPTDAAPHAEPEESFPCSGQHPNGPWSIDTDDLRDNGRYGYAVFDADQWCVSDHSCLQNAQLISAAPDLLKAVKALLAAADVDFDGESVSLDVGAYDEAATLAKAAIAKAEGQ